MADNTAMPTMPRASNAVEEAECVSAETCAKEVAESPVSEVASDAAEQNVETGYAGEPDDLLFDFRILRHFSDR